MNISELYNIFKNSSGVTTDSRNIRGGELFFALKGENFDGNDYAVKALEAGAGYAVVSAGAEAVRKAIETSVHIDGVAVTEKFVMVEDTLKTLQELARWHRSMTFVNGKPIPVIGLTGTNGKTTTKELLKAVLSVHYKVAATEGNLNNSIGVPLTLLKINEGDQIAIVEMGASHPGDIKELVSVCLPNFGLITNVGKGHLLGFGDYEGVKRAKGELYDYIQRTADKVFINVDDAVLTAMAAQRPDLQTIPYGVKYRGAEVLPSDGEHPFLRLELGSLVIETQLIGSYNASNVMAALAVGEYFGVGIEDAARAIGAYVPTNNRSQLVQTGKNVLIVDAYNANPSSMAAALENFAGVGAEHKSLMLGNMLELGEESVAEHIRLYERALACGAENVFLVGGEFQKALGAGVSMDEATADGASAAGASVAGAAGSGRARIFGTSDELADWISEHPIVGHTILIKGSRGSRMENVIKVL